MTGNTAVRIRPPPPLTKEKAMTETIKSIERFDDDDEVGYRITTDQQTITFGISNYEQCCEAWGTIVSEDNLNDFAGAEILTIELVEHVSDAYVPREMLKRSMGDRYGGKSHDYDYDPEGNYVFINVNTSKGMLQFTLYNLQNGYYGHDVKITSAQLTKELTL
jgi:hypothetical protein